MIFIFYLIIKSEISLTDIVNKFLFTQQARETPICGLKFEISINLLYKRNNELNIIHRIYVS